MPHLNHIALLVRSVEKTAKALAGHGFDFGPTDTFESEGTKEIYVNQGNAGSLLLMEAIGPGPYQRALEKRGPGLHHLALDVPKLDPFLASVCQAGWTLHPVSRGAIERSRTAYLFRTGFPALIEVQERNAKETPLFITSVELSLGQESSRLLSAIGLHEIVRPAKIEPALWIGELRLPLRPLLGDSA